jgi:hypothetical protein
MTELMKRAFAAASKLPSDRQEELARYLLALSEAGGDLDLMPDEAAAIAEAEAELARGERASEDKVDEFWRRNGL